MLIYSLTTTQPLTKTISKVAGSIEKTSYPLTWEFTSAKHNITTAEQLYHLVRNTSTKGGCLIKGELHRTLKAESRAGATVTGDLSSWVCLDIDGIPTQADITNAAGQLVKVNVTPDFIMTQLGLHDISYVVQYSASHGLDPARLSCHIFFLLTHPLPAPSLKQWLIQQNFNSALFVNAMSLTKTGNTLHWPLDISACQNDKLLYVAAPIFKGMKDPLKARISLVKRKHGAATIPLAAIHSPGQNKVKTEDKINELRLRNGLPKRKFTYKLDGAVEYLSKPDRALVTEMKTERGFVYFNLNGGDSWAYYHPENNPQYIFNFKGEPTYLTKELIPDYWAQVQSTGHAAVPGNSTLSAFAFQDELSSTYYGGTYDTITNQLELHPFKTLKMLKDYAAQYNIAWTENVPSWRVVFDPGDVVRVDFANRRINLFEPSIYMLNPPNKVAKPPKTIHKFVSHALGNDAPIVAHFYNWLAFIVQFRTRTGTAWILQGAPGTGKGILTNLICTPLLGRANVRTKRMEELNDQFNDYLSKTLLVSVDEMELKAIQFGKQKSVMANLKNYITEPTISVRGMFRAALPAINYSNWLFNTNEHVSLRLDLGDRRFNVAAYQNTPIKPTAAEIRVIHNELEDFFDYLAGLQVDEHAAATPMQTSAKDDLIDRSRTVTEQFVEALKHGDIKYFLEQLPSDKRYMTDHLQHEKVKNYKEDLRTLLTRKKTSHGNFYLSRDELNRMYTYITDEKLTSAEFGKRMANHGMRLSTARLGDGSLALSMKVDWPDYTLFPQYLDDYPVVDKTSNPGHLKVVK